MKNVFSRKFASALVFGAILVSGCAKKESVEKPVYDAVAPAVAPAVVAQPAAPTPENRLAYYEANLEKAKEVWIECKRVGPQNMSESERKDCSMARVAWQNQPFEPRK